ncbi:MAG TPA: hypothetical protein VKB95_16815 [Chitinophagaceae bacterium]|nr:hypothetical protein [Chitinophagaceae bacterium]
MKPIIQQLLKKVETGEQEEKLSCLPDISDYIEHEDGYAKVVQQLIVLLSKETDPEVKKIFVRNIEMAYMYKINLEVINFEPLMGILDNADPFFIPSVLYLLSMTYSRKYIPVVEKFLSHSNKEIRGEAQYILDIW